ncbi:MAG: TPM domain-containing protein [Bacteroidetes bacterium]|nr:TPM domain-containing protein [Bacteroidota bacterium]
MRRLLLISIVFLRGFYVFAQVEDYIPKRSNPPRLVNDLSKTGFLTESQRDALEKKLVAFDDSTSNQIAVVVVESLEGYSANEFATALGRAWGVGGKEKNNGIVVLISTGGGDGQRDAYIATGYGLEGAVPDATARAITDIELIAHLKKGEPYRALDRTTDALMKAAAWEYVIPRKYKRQREVGSWLGWATIVFIFLLMVLGRRGGGGRGGGMMWGGPVTWGGGGWSSGGGWSGGSGGGFGGFGGGSFGGGGAGGKW